MNIKLSQERIALSISILFFTSLIFIAKIFHGTGDEGDSVMHFLFSKWAFKHPYHFFHHWAKPLYVLITSIPAQLGFFGIQVFNISINAVSIYLTFLVAQKLNIRYAWLASLFLAVFPHQIVYSLSGLTEPLFAFALITLITLWLHGKKFSSILLLSFLPFIRSEGMIVIVVFLIYLICKKDWKFIPLLITGHVIYSIAGVLAYDKSLLWVFTENPYAVGATSYGSGPWDAFINHLRYSTGIILYFIFWAGMLLGAVFSFLKFIIKKKVNFSLEDFLLIYGIFFSVFFFHSFAWYKGWFHSFGLIRVMVGVLPLAAIICAKALDESFKYLPNDKFLMYKITGYVFIIVLLNFSIKKYAIVTERDLNLRGDQQCQQEVANYMNEFYPDYKKLPVYFTAPYISEVLNVDYFDDAVHPDFKNDFHNNRMRKPCYVVWDDWYAPVESNVSFEAIESNPSLKKIKKFWHWDIAGGKDRVTILYKLE